MSREEAKVMSEVLKAYSERKPILFRSKKGELRMWIEIVSDSLNFDFENFEYRIAVHDSIRPYDNAKEFMNAQAEHGIWLKCKANGAFHLPTACNVRGVEIIGVIKNYETIMKEYTFAKGHPCGIREETL